MNEIKNQPIELTAEQAEEFTSKFGDGDTEFRDAVVDDRDLLVNSINVNDTAVPPATPSRDLFHPPKHDDNHAVKELTALIKLLQDPTTSKLKYQRAEKRVKKILKQHVREHQRHH